MKKFNNGYFDYTATPEKSKTLFPSDLVDDDATMTPCSCGKRTGKLVKRRPADNDDALLT